MFNYDPFFTAPMAEFLLRFFGGGLLHPFDTRPFVEDDIQSLAVDVFENNGRMVVDASLPGEKSGDLDTTIPANKTNDKN